MTSPRKRWIPRPVPALLLLPMLVALTGCDAEQLGAAAILNGKTITVEQLQAGTKEYLKVQPSFDKGDAQQQILNRLIATEVIGAAAGRHNVSVSDGEVASERDAILEQVGGRKKLVMALTQLQNPEVLPPSYINRWVRDRVLLNKLVEKVAAGRDPNTEEVGGDMRSVFVSAADSLDIEVNPRYGKWSSDELGVEPLVGGGLSKSLTEIVRASRTN